MIVKRILVIAQNVFIASRQNHMFGNAMQKNTTSTQSLAGDQEKKKYINRGIIKMYSETQNNQSLECGKYKYSGSNIEKIPEKWLHNFDDYSILSCPECGKSVHQLLFFDTPKFCPYCGIEIGADK